MKDNGSTIDGGSLYLGPAPRPDARYELAEFIAAYVKIIKQEADVDLYALSIQNELAFVEPYNSCVYTPTEFRDVLKAVGQRFVAESFTTKIFGPECMGTYTRNDGVRNYLGPINADPEAKQHLHIVAVHSYKDGVAPDYGSAPGWDSIYQAAVRLGNRPLWMTETGSGTASAWGDNGMDAAKRIYLALKHGKISAWVWWYLRDELMADGVTPRPAFYASKHYFRYIRPGAKMVGCGADNGDLLVTAFRHDGLNSFTIVVVNQGSSSQNVSLSGSGLPAQFDIHQSTSADPRCSPKGSVASTAQLSVPGTSVTTLHAGTFVGGTGVQRPRQTPSPRLPLHHGSPARAARWYALSGRMLGNSPRPPAGAFYVGPARGSSGRFSLVAVPRR
jgi:O-glycosyl hydrolase